MVTPDPTSPMTKKTPRQSKASPINSLKGGPRQDRPNYDRRLLVGQFLEPILEDPSKSPRKQQNITDTKKWSWLSKKNASSTEDLPATPLKRDLATQPYEQIGHPDSALNPRTNVAAVEDHEARKRTWFQKVFKRKEQHISVSNDHQVLPADADETDDVADLFTPARRGNRRGGRPQSQSEYPPNAPFTQPEISQNWFAKFLHLKPATKVVVMRASKAQARREVVKILREWRKFGIRDVVVEKRPTGDVVRARVDAANCKLSTACRVKFRMLTLPRFTYSTCTVRCHCIYRVRTRETSQSLYRQVHSRERSC